jgi:hypothetical protein
MPSKEVRRMKVLYLLRSEPDDTGNKIMEEHKKSNEVTVIDLTKNKNYDEIVDAIASNDKVISW